VAAGRMHGVAEDPRSRVSAVVVKHESALLRVARQFSMCQDDALDAYQRALEIFVRRVEKVDPATEVAWLKVVIRHEAMAIRRARSESLAGEELDVDALPAGAERSVEDQIASGERVRRSAEALRALKPDEAQALMMKAHGLTYEEIGERNGWTYTKVNRAITEGRRRFLRVYEGIEAGEECDRLAPIVEALASGDATSKQVLEIRPHLRHCSACRAAVRDLHLSRLRRASLLWPAWVVAAIRPGRRTADPDVPSLEEVLEIEPVPDHGLFASIKHEIAAFFHRFNASDVATGLHIATSGGGRVSSLAALVALCLSSVTAGTVCVVTGVIPSPGAFVPSPSREGPRAEHSRRPPPEVERNASTPPSRPRLAQPRVLIDPRPSERVSAETRKPRRPRRSRPLPNAVSGRTDAAQHEFGLEGATSPTDAARPGATSAISAASSTPSRPREPVDPVKQEFDPATQEFSP
jgi:RNA polymerase sigma factor (sigma-70 family)